MVGNLLDNDRDRCNDGSEAIEIAISYLVECRGAKSQTARVGIWLIGARGRLTTTAAVRLAVLQRGLIAETCLVRKLPQFRRLDLADWTDFAVGGHEIRDLRLIDEAA